MNNLSLECVNIINDTPTELNKEISKDTTKRWERKCPQCNKIIFHSRKDSRDVSIRKNRICNICRGLNSRIHRSDGFLNVDGKIKWIRNCPNCNNVIYYENRIFRNSTELKKHICIECQRKLHSIIMKGRRQSIDDRKKKRISKINYIIHKNGGVRPMCNIKACKYFDKLNEEKGWNFQHALNGGEYHIKELGYFIDGYDKEKNIVIEYDELHHNYPKYKEKDIKRMNEIINHLGCKFLRYNEKTNELKEY